MNMPIVFIIPLFLKLSILFINIIYLLVIACSNGINDCEHLKTIMNCGECDRFPCEKINAVFEKTDSVNKSCKDKCTEREYIVLRKAFFMKRQILTDINVKHRNKNK